MILIVGSSRSGTTWLAKAFDSHPDVLYRHEPDSTLVNAAIPFVPGRDNLEPLYPLAARYLDELAAHRSIKSIGSIPVFYKNYRGWLGSWLYRVCILGLKGTSSYFGKSKLVRRLRFPDFIVKRSQPRRCVIKSVDSLCRSYVFSRADPELKIIHIVRHPCGRISSLLRGIKQRVMGSPSHLHHIVETEEAKEHGLTLEKMLSYGIVTQMAYHWMLLNEKVMRELDQYPNYRLVRYEDLCADPEKVARELFEFADLPWDPQTERFLTYSQSDGTRKEAYYGVVRAPLAAANAWRDELSAEQIAEIKAVVADSPPGRLFEEPST